MLSVGSRGAFFAKSRVIVPAKNPHCSVELIDVKRKGFELRTKYSVSDKVQKVYAHTLYQATIKELPKKLQADSFMIGDRKYSWWSIDKMEADEDIREHNFDVVELVKHNIV